MKHYLISTDDGTKTLFVVARSPKEAATKYAKSVLKHNAMSGCVVTRRLVPGESIELYSTQRFWVRFNKDIACVLREAAG